MKWLRVPLMTRKEAYLNNISATCELPIAKTGKKGPQTLSNYFLHFKL
jgi:hypothetical protein